MNRKNLLDRIEKCRQILEANPGSQIFAALAEAYRKLGDLKAALDVCTDGLARHPDYGSGHLVLAKIARDQKRLAEAEKAALRSVELEGSTRSAELLLSEIYLETGKFADAEKLLNRLAEADPANEPVQKLRALARKAGRAASVAKAGDKRTVRTDGPVAAGPADPPPTAEPPAAQPESPAAESPAQAPPTPEPGDALPAPDAEAETGEAWREIFVALDRYPHLLGKLAVGHDGMLLQTDIQIRSEAESAAAMAAELFRSVHGEWPAGDFGPLEQLLVETEQSTWWLWVFPSFLLVLWCDPAINMGPLRLRINRTEGVLASITPGGNP